MIEFSRVKLIKSGLPEGGKPYRFEASSNECALIAERLDLVGVSRLAVSGRLRRGPRSSIVIVHGEIEADVVQRCVVTFDSVPATLTIPFERYFSSEQTEVGEEIIVGVDDEDPDPFDGESLDVGEIATEELALSLEPYPRSPGADEVLSHLLPQDTSDDESVSPFAKLQALKRRDPD